MSASSSTLNEAAKIKPLQGRNDWIVQDEKLQGQLGMIDLYVILIDPTHRPSPEDNPKEYRKWDEYQRPLRALLLCITGPHPKALLMNSRSLKAVDQYALLKAEYNTQTITTFNHLYRKIHRCSISSHKPDLSNLRAYGCDAYVVDYKAKDNGKFAPRAWAGTLVGCEAKNQWRI